MDIRFVTPEAACAYLPGRISRLEVRMVDEMAPAEEEAELDAGWRRFGRVLFQRACIGCESCVPLRIPIRSFRPSKSQRRVLRRNADVSIEVGEPILDEERLDLHERYHEARRVSRGWPAPSRDPDEYRASFIDNPSETLEIRYRLGGRLIGVAYVGKTLSALNSMYAFHDPQLGRRSLGTFDVLTEIEAARAMELDHVYLGYLVEGCLSMEYKKAFRPHELLIEGEWRPGG